MKLAIEVMGWFGATLIILAYALLSSGKLTGDSKLYHYMNIVGAVGFVVNSGWNGAFPSAALNVVWIGIGSYALLQRRRPQVKSGAPIH
ncbi:MAG: CBU_0592 family membrane protein [Steroidobacteraceae bacterium]